MSIETTIGIISGIIAIVTAIIQLKNHYFSQRKQGKEPFIKRPQVSDLDFKPFEHTL